jgi:SMODS and SLOG-associating 2TM effector domain
MPYSQRRHRLAILPLSTHTCAAKMTGYSLNVAIAVQVLLGALTTGLGAALSGKSVRTMPYFPLSSTGLASLTYSHL